MARIASRFWVLSAILVALNVAGIVWIQWTLGRQETPRIRVLAALPGDAVEEADRFTLVFDEAIAGPEQVGQTLDNALFVVDPAPAGWWQWAAPDRLEYMLDEPLPPGRLYHVRPAADFEARVSRKLVGEERFEFRTQSLRLIHAAVDSADRQHVSLRFQFNQPVEPGELLRCLRVTGSGDASPERLEAEALTADPGDEIVVRVSRPAEDQLTVVLDQNMVGAGGQLPLGRDIKRDMSISTLFACVRASADQPGLDPQTQLRFRFTHPLSSAQAAPKLRFEPAVQNVRTRISYRYLYVTGDFEPDRTYRATLPATLLARDEQTLGREQTLEIQVPPYRPMVRFSNTRGLLSPRGNLLVDLKATNTQSIYVDVERLHANNLVPHLVRSNWRATGRTLPSQTIRLGGDVNGPTDLSLDLRSVVDQPTGVYRLRAKASERAWARASCTVTVTDLAITAKQQRGGYLAWVTSLRTAEPMMGVTLTAMSYNNQPLAVAVTDAEGLAELDVPENGVDGPVYVIVAEHEGDLSYIQPNRRMWTFENTTLAGRQLPNHYDVMAYTERGVYRPGDVVHFTGVVRQADGAVPPGLPMTVSVFRPDGRRVAQYPVMTEPDSQGMFHVDHPTRADDQFGRYRFEVTLPGADERLGGADALVEAFVPLRIEMDADATQARFAPGQPVAIDVSARYLFGQPAAELPVKAGGRLTPVRFEHDAFEGFAFGPMKLGKAVRLTEIKTTLSDSGQAILNVALPEKLSRGVYRLPLDVTVTEPGARSVSRAARSIISTQSHHLGLKLVGGRISPVGQEAQVRWVWLHDDGSEALTDRIDFKLVRVAYETTIEVVNGRRVWKSHEQEHEVTKITSTGGGQPLSAGIVPVRCPQPGRYRLIGIEKETGIETAVQFWAADATHPAPPPGLERPDRLELVLDRERYLSGDVATLLLRSPFVGQALITLETDRVVHRQVIELVQQEQTVTLPVTPAMRNGAIVSATVIRPVDPTDTDWLPHRARGVTRLRYDNAHHRASVRLAAPTRIEPGQRVTVEVSTDAVGGTEPGVVHLWAVDEGVLLTTHHRTPDPLKHFLAERAATVRSSDLFDDLLPDHDRPADITRIGAGDELAVVALRRNPVAMRRTAPAVVWSRHVPLDDDGRAALTLTMPESCTEMRLMAVVIAGDRYTGTQTPLTLTRDLVVEVAAPRAVTRGDRFGVPVKLFNTTDQRVSTRLLCKTDGPVEIAAQTDLDQIMVDPYSGVTVWLDATATGYGPVRLAFDAQSGDRDLNAGKTTLDLVSRPIAPLHSRSRLLRFDAGESHEIKPIDGFAPGFGQTTISIGSSPQVQLRPAVERLLDYPYGCVEQTTSRMIALVHAPRLLENTGDGSRADMARSMVDAGIARLWSMQTRSGGLSYWPGGQKPMLWGSAYVALCLQEASQAGHKIDRQFADPLHRYLAAELNNTHDTSITANQRAMLCRVLASGDKPPLGWMARLSEQADRLDIGGRAHLAVAWLQLGRRERALAVLSDDTLGQVVASTSRGRITSQLRQEALLLDALVRLDPDHAWAPVLAKRINDARQASGGWANTLENATVIAALSRYQAVRGEPEAYEGRLTVSDRAPLAFESGQPFVNTVNTVDQPVRLASTGSGSMYVVMTAEGLAEGEIESYDRQLRVRRAYKDVDGNAIDLLQLEVGDLVMVEIKIEAVGAERSVHNIAIVDLLPGCLEVDNPRLASSSLSGRREANLADRVEFHDDRVLMFTSAGSDVRTFAYPARVTASGAYRLPPIQASCIYDPAFASVHGTIGTVEIKR